MDTIQIKNACGLDVHKQTIMACIIIKGKQKQLKEFGTTTEELEALRDWMNEHQVTHVAMESTGVYWKPVFNIIGEDFQILLANARHMKNVPGRKTDVKDAEWICQLLRVGLLKGSFIPPENIRQLRNLTRYQNKLQGQLKSEKNRVYKLLEEANIKIASVLSDLFGLTGSKILEDLANGVTSAETLHGHVEREYRLKNKKKAALKALHGRFTPHHQFLLRTMLDHIFFIEQKLQSLEEQADTLLAAHEEEQELLKTIPGIQKKAAGIIIAEIGANMDQFTNEHHLASWAGLSPGNNQSAGKQKSGRIGPGNKWLKAALVQAAWAAVRKQGHYLRAKYYQLVKRMGRKKALIAIAHKLLKACYLIIKGKVPYKDLGMDYVDKGREAALLKHYVKKLSDRGYKVMLEPVAVA